MILNKNSFLKHLAFTEGLKNNLLSVIFGLHSDIDISNKELFYSILSPFYKRYSTKDRTSIIIENEEVTELEEWKNLDLRIKKFYLHSLRYFPPTKDNTPYGIDFTGNSDEPKSMIILGENAIGKSSIYNVIEYMFCQRIGEAELRSSTGQDDSSLFFKSYLQHFSIPFDQAFSKIDLNCGKSFQLNIENIPANIRTKINPNNNFISDFDIYSTGQLNFTDNSANSFQNLIAKNLGYSDLLEFKKQIHLFANYSRRAESTKKNNLEREITNSVTLINNNEASILDKKSQLAKIKTNNESDIEPENLTEILQICDILLQFKVDLEFKYDDFVSVSFLFTDTFNSLNKIDFNVSELDRLQFYKTGIQYVVAENECPICKSSNSSPQEIVKLLNQKISIAEEYNTVSMQLNKNVSSLVSMLSKLSSDLNNLRGKIFNLINLVKPHNEFNEIAKLLDQVLSILNELHSYDFFHLISAIEDQNINFYSRMLHLKEIIRDVNNWKTFYTLVDSIPKYTSIKDKLVNKTKTAILAKVQDTSIIGNIIVLQKEIENLELQNKSEYLIIENKKKQLEEILLIIEDFNRLQKDSKEYYNVLNRKLNEEIKKSFDPIQKTVKTILDKYIYNEDRQVTLKIEMKPELVDESTGEVITEIITAYIESNNNQYERIEVNKYFNTFHYRLFCMMVSLSISIASRKSTQINLPLFIDDVFSASDFKNLFTIEEFIEKIYSLYTEFSPEMPLQLVLFTHDHFVFNSIKNSSLSNSIKNITFAKLLDYSESSAETDYKTLISEIPVFLPQYKLLNV